MTWFARHTYTTGECVPSAFTAAAWNVRDRLPGPAWPERCCNDDGLDEDGEPCNRHREDDPDRKRDERIEGGYDGE